ncbi:MAG: hypothetical protein K2J80_07425 [Oscillospiraceae bacterium]|nr:hypothetical protein [Oscillospiraceae bacterium]
MADDKYSIDDILKEIDSSRGTGSKKGSFNGSVTDILGESDEIDKLIKAGRQQRKPDISVTEVIDSVGRQRTPVKSAKQRTDREVEARIASDVSKAADKRRAVIPDDDDVVEYAARQRTESEFEARVARDISNAADMKRWEELSGSYDDDEDDDVKSYSPENDGSYYDNGNDEIELHDANTFTPSDTMQMRRMNKINEIQNAMLKFDSEAETPDEILDSLNPMESREKAAEQLRGNEDTDTLAVSGNELKSLGKGEERIKEYTPSVSRKREHPDAENASAARQSPFTGELHVGESIIDALNKKINEESAEFSVPIKQNISVPGLEEPEDDGELDKIKQADELARKKKRKLSEFILDGRDDTEETDKVEDRAWENYEKLEDEEDDEAPIDLNDENVIRDRLLRASKGLWGRLIILAVLFAAAVFIGAVNIFRIDIGRLGNMLSYRSSPENYLYAHLVIGIFSFTACSSVVSNGFSRLIKLRPDGDTLCALAHTGAIVAIIPYLASQDYIQRGFSHVYLAVSLAALIFNTVSKLLTVKTAQKNFDFVFGGETKHFIERCSGNGAEQLAKGAVDGLPAVASIRKTEMLCDFIVSTYCEDSSDRTSRKIAPIAIAAAIIGGVIAYFTCKATIVKNYASWAATASSAILAVSAAFSSSMTVTLPMYLASRKAKTRGVAVLGYEAAEEMSETNAVLANAKMLFPADTIKIVNICGYDTPKTRGEGKINIDEAIIYAASLAVAADSVMSDALFHILNYKRELLKPVSGCVYENNLGVMGWIDRRRVLLGTRAHMKAHEITVPNTKKEAAANTNNDEVIYLAVGGEVCLLFFVKPTADPIIRRSVRELAFRNISIVVKTVDGMISAPVIAKVFGIDEDNVKILPFELHETFDENTKFISSGSAAVSSDGSFPSLSNAVNASRAIRDKAAIGNILQFVGVILGFIIAIIFTLVTNEEALWKFNAFNVFNVLLYSTVWGALTLGIQFFRRT